MTKEEIIDELYRLLSDNRQGIPLRDEAQKERYKEAVKGAVKALEQEPCEDAISRKATLDAFLKELRVKDVGYLTLGEKALYNMIKNMPPVTPAREHGEWIFEYDNSIVTFYHCSVCGRKLSILKGGRDLSEFPYCPCGAKMNGRKSDEVSIMRKQNKD